ncbi:MAG: polysaccharide biosynthesis/export family protein [Acidobacteriota bacterium]
MTLGAGLLGGCAARTPVEAPEIVTQPLPAPASLPYRLQPGDLLAVKFWGADELDEEVRVRPDGKISLPFIDDVDAAGRTPDQLDAELTTLYASELARPNITVIVREATAPRIYIGGEVGRQGALEITDGLTLFRAIQEAGGFTTTAQRQQVVVIRATADGQAVARAVDLMPVLSGEDPGRDVVLAANDVVFVPRTRIRSVALFVEQYIDEIIPLQNVLGGLILADITQDDDDNSSAGDAATAGAEGDGTP